MISRPHIFSHGMQFRSWRNLLGCYFRFCLPSRLYSNIFDRFGFVREKCVRVAVISPPHWRELCPFPKKSVRMYTRGIVLPWPSYFQHSLRNKPGFRIAVLQPLVTASALQVPFLLRISFLLIGCQLPIDLYSQVSFFNVRSRCSASRGCCQAYRFTKALWI